MGKKNRNRSKKKNENISKNVPTQLSADASSSNPSLPTENMQLGAVSDTTRRDPQEISGNVSAAGQITALEIGAVCAELIKEKVGGSGSLYIDIQNISIQPLPLAEQETSKSPRKKKVSNSQRKKSTNSESPSAKVIHSSQANRNLSPDSLAKKRQMIEESLKNIMDSKSVVEDSRGLSKSKTLTKPSHKPDAKNVGEDSRGLGTSKTITMPSRIPDAKNVFEDSRGLGTSKTLIMPPPKSDAKNVGEDSRGLSRSKTLTMPSPKPDAKNVGEDRSVGTSKRSKRPSRKHYERAIRTLARPSLNPSERLEKLLQLQFQLSGGEKKAHSCSDCDYGKLQASNNQRSSVNISDNSSNVPSTTNYVPYDSASNLSTDIEYTPKNRQQRISACISSMMTKSEDFGKLEALIESENIPNVEPENAENLAEYTSQYREYLDAFKARLYRKLKPMTLAAKKLNEEKVLIETVENFVPKLMHRTKVSVIKPMEATVKSYLSKQSAEFKDDNLTEIEREFKTRDKEIISESVSTEDTRESISSQKVSERVSEGKTTSGALSREDFGENFSKDTSEKVSMAGTSEVFELPSTEEASGGISKTSSRKRLKKRSSSKVEVFPEGTPDLRMDVQSVQNLWRDILRPFPCFISIWNANLPSELHYDSSEEPLTWSSNFFTVSEADSEIKSNPLTESHSKELEESLMNEPNQMLANLKLSSPETSEDEFEEFSETSAENFPVSESKSEYDTCSSTIQSVEGMSTTQRTPENETVYEEADVLKIYMQIYNLNSSVSDLIDNLKESAAEMLKIIFLCSPSIYLQPLQKYLIESNSLQMRCSELRNEVRSLFTLARDIPLEYNSAYYNRQFHYLKEKLVIAKTAEQLTYDFGRVFAEMFRESYRKFKNRMSISRH